MGDQVSIQGNGHVNNCFTSWFLYALLKSSHQSLVSKTSKQMALGGMYENTIRNLPSKNPKEISFSESATRPVDRGLSLLHGRVSIYSMYLPSSEPVSEISTLKCMYDQWKCTTGFFLMQEAFQDHTALQSAMEWVTEVYSSNVLTNLCLLPSFFFGG